MEYFRNRVDFSLKSGQLCFRPLGGLLEGNMGCAVLRNLQEVNLGSTFVRFVLGPGGAGEIKNLLENHVASCRIYQKSAVGVFCV